MTTPNPIPAAETEHSTAEGIFHLVDLVAKFVGLASMFAAMGITWLHWKFPAVSAEHAAFLAIFCAGVSTIASLPAPGARRRAAASSTLDAPQAAAAVTAPAADNLSSN